MCFVTVLCNNPIHEEELFSLHIPKNYRQDVTQIIKSLDSIVWMKLRINFSSLHSDISQICRPHYPNNLYSDHDDILFIYFVKLSKLGINNTNV